MTPLVSNMLEEASRVSGLSDFGDEWFLESLSAYAGDLDSPHISPWGRAFLTRLAHKDLIRRLAIIDCLKRNPQIEDTPLPPILYITGHERSGTTLLHNLLSLHQGARFLSRWQLMLPTPPPEAASIASDPRRQEVKKSIDALRGSDLETMHWVEADDPEECVWGFMDCTGLLGMAPSLILPGWLAWMQQADLTPTFVNYRKVVQLLTWKNPVPEGGFLVLKSPQVSSYLPGFSRVFPEATFLYLHRDPYRVLSSFCTLIDIVDGPFLDSPSYVDTKDREERLCLERMAGVYGKMADFEDAHPERVHNVQYADLLANPVDEIPGIFRSVDFPVDPGLADRIEAFGRRQSAGGRAAPRPSLSDHGYSREIVETHPALAAYLRRYRVNLEKTRQTGFTEK